MIRRGDGSTMRCYAPRVFVLMDADGGMINCTNGRPLDNAARTPLSRILASAQMREVQRAAPHCTHGCVGPAKMEGTILYSLGPSAVVHYLLRALFHRALPPDAGEGSCAAIAADAHPRWYVTSVPFNLRCG